MKNAATTLRDVVVTNEQTRVPWDAGRAAIERGAIVIEAGAFPPAGLTDRPASTFTITAIDGIGRTRCFAGVTLDLAASEPPARYVFV